MRYIRRIDNPLIVKASGFVGPGGLGDFDPAVYEEVEGELPDGWQQEVVLTFQQQIQAAFESLSDEKQNFYEDEIVKAAFFLERNNTSRLAQIIQRAEDKLRLPGDEDVQAIITLAKTELGLND